MKYILMMNTPSGGPYKVASWAQKDLQAHIAFMKGFATKLGEAGELVAAEGLAGPDQAKLVRAGKDGIASPPCAPTCWRRPAIIRPPSPSTAPPPTWRPTSRSAITS